jgi:hypothetical protein
MNWAITCVHVESFRVYLRLCDVCLELRAWAPGIMTVQPSEFISSCQRQDQCHKKGGTPLNNERRLAREVV